MGMHDMFDRYAHHHHHRLADHEAWMRDCAGRSGRAGRFGDDDGESRGGRGGWGGRHGGRFGGRMFGHGDLRLVLLALISEQPRHGYELIRVIEEMFDGAYAPSPGVVYPTLTLLEDMGHASVAVGEGGKKQYTITDEGRAWLEENRDAVDAVMARMQAAAKMASRMAAPMAIREAMHTLRHALSAHPGPWSPAEAKRVLGIIKRAADEIVGGGTPR